MMVECGWTENPFDNTSPRCPAPVTTIITATAPGRSPHRTRWCTQHGEYMERRVPYLYPGAGVVITVSRTDPAPWGSVTHLVSQSCPHSDHLPPAHLPTEARATNAQAH